MEELTVAPCSSAAAAHAVLAWHYSQQMPVGKLVNLGVWEGGRFIGAVIFGRGANRNLCKPYGLDQSEVCELVRVALTDHAAPVSRVVSAALSYLRRTNPGLRMVVSFADPEHGHKGGIYQAGNWIYSGMSSSSKRFSYQGKLLHQRQVSETGFITEFGKTHAAPPRQACEVVEISGKHRYLMPLDKAMRRRLAKLAQPYPHE